MQTSRRIFKYPVQLQVYQHLQVKEGFRFLPTVAIQHGNITLWGEVDDRVDALTSIIVFVVGTGHPVPDEATRYIGTVAQAEFIWHVYTDEEA